MKRNKAVLNDLPVELYTTEANNKILDNYKYPVALIQAAQNQTKKNKRLTNKGDLTKLVKLIIDATVSSYYRHTELSDLSYSIYSRQ